MQSIYIYKSEFVRFVAPSDLSRRPTLSEKILMRRVIVLNNAFNMEFFTVCIINNALCSTYYQQCIMFWVIEMHRKRGEAIGQKKSTS